MIPVRRVGRLRRVARATFDTIVFAGAALATVALFAAITACAAAPFVLMYAAAAWLVSR